MNPVPRVGTVEIPAPSLLRLIPEALGRRTPLCPYTPNAVPHTHRKALSAPDPGARTLEGREGGREGSPGPAPCAPIKPGNRRSPLRGFWVTLDGTVGANRLWFLAAAGTLGFCHSQSAVSNVLLPDLGRSRAQQVGAAGGACEEEEGAPAGDWERWGSRPLRGCAPTFWAQLVHSPGTPDPSAPPDPSALPAQFRGAEQGTWHREGASPAGPVTRSARANAAGASVRPGR